MFLCHKHFNSSVKTVLFSHSVEIYGFAFTEMLHRPVGTLLGTLGPPNALLVGEFDYENLCPDLSPHAVQQNVYKTLTTHVV